MTAGTSFRFIPQAVFKFITARAQSQGFFRQSSFDRVFYFAIM